MSKSFREQLAVIDSKIAGIETARAAAIEKVVEGFVAKLAKLSEERAELAVKAESELDVSRIEAGTEVQFTYGRADSKKTLTGTVLGRKSQPKGADLISVSVGSGFDATVVKVYVTNVTAIGPFAEQA